MSTQQFEDKPRLLGDSTARQARLAQLYDPHIAPLTTFVESLRSTRGLDYEIPYFDPWDGGVDAEVLFLFEAPGPKAKGSGFISRNNPDQTAHNFFHLNKDLIARKRTVSWNIVPWYIGTSSRIRPANTNDILDGMQSLNSLLQLLPRLKAIVLFGRKAQKAESRCPSIKIFKSPHPSPQFVNRASGNRERILQELRAVALFLM